MAKRGRPSKKTLKKRKEVKQKSELMLLFSILLLVAAGVFAYFMLIK